MEAIGVGFLYLIKVEQCQYLKARSTIRKTRNSPHRKEEFGGPGGLFESRFAADRPTTLHSNQVRAHTDVVSMYHIHIEATA